MALDVAAQLDDNDPVKGRLYNALDDAFRVLDTRDPLGTAAFYESVAPAAEVLKHGIAAAGAPMDVNVIGIGHAHIDVAWLWTLGQTVRKSGRSFSNVLRLMEQFPDYKFSQSQPQLYQYTEEYYPEIFAGIKQRVAEGRWEPMGGTWVEPDCNAIGAELLARQFLLGRGYFRKHFGDVDTPVLWLPDTFGYSWALPQLIKLAGMKYFITHKMSWNQYNRMPNEFLWWQGLDGTQSPDAFPDHARRLRIFATRDDLQRRNIGSRNLRHLEELSAKRDVQRIDHGLWLWRRRRRPDARNARKCRKPGESSRRAARPAWHYPRVHGAGRKRNRRHAAGLEWRVLF